MNNIKNIPVFITLFLSVALYYWRSIFAFFQGDEWVYFSFFLPLTKRWDGIFLAFYKSIADVNSVSSGAHLTPIYNIIWFLNNQFFGLNYFPYILLSIIVHVINSYIIYILVSNLVKKKNIALIASLFFALSYNHQQSVTWIMAYIPTSISVTFFLFCVLFVKQAISHEGKKPVLKKVKFAFLFFLLSLLTKETTAILFIIVPLMVIIYKRELFKTYFLRLYIYIFTFYLLYRIGIPKLFSWIESLNGVAHTASTKLDFSLIILRLFTYPLKVLSQVFIPAGVVLSWVEDLTPLAYPQYAVDNGANFVNFTQGPGSDMVFYLIGVLFLLSFIFYIKWEFKFKNNDKANALILGLLIVLLSSYPLILIALYAPWWGYTAYIDSRHLYIASVGASILFAISVTGISAWLSKIIHVIAKIKIEQNKVLVILVVIWSISQFILLQKDLDQQVLTGEQRKTVLSAILKTVPQNSSRKIILVESDTAYYTFYAIPPFQTNLGQALMVHYYQSGNLPESFINVGANLLTKGDLQAQGIVTYEGKSFGYFIDKNTVLERVEKGEFKLDELIAFHWNGGNNTIEDQTSKVRSEIEKVIEIKELNKDWKEYKDDNTGVAFIYPPSMTLSEEDPKNEVISKTVYLKKSQYSVKVEISKVPVGLGFYDVMKSYYDSDGNNLKGIIVKTFVLDPLHKSNALMADSGNLPKYFVPTHHEVVSFLVEESDEEGLKILEQIIGSVNYKKN